MFVLAGIWREGKHGGKIKNPIPDPSRWRFLVAGLS
jgi:hypothetical protein